MTKVFLLEAWDLGGGAILLGLFLFVAGLLVCRFVTPLAAGNRILYGSLQGICLILVSLLFIVLYLMIFFVPLLGLLAIAWCIPTAAWIVFSPLLVGSYLKERYGLKGAVAVTGVLLVVTSFIIQFAGTYKK